MKKIKIVVTDFYSVLILEKLLKMTELDFDSVLIATHNLEFDISSAKIKIETGKGERFGLDGGSPQRSERLAEKCREEIFSALDGAEFVLGITNLGCDDGEGIPPVVADVAKKIGALSVFVTLVPQDMMVPFRERYSREYLAKLETRADSVMQIDEKFFFKQLPPKTLVTDALDMMFLSVAQDVKNILDYYVSKACALST